MSFVCILSLLEISLLLFFKLSGVHSLKVCSFAYTFLGKLKMRTAASASLCFYCHLLLSAITGTSSANLHSPETALAGAIRILDGGFGSDDGASGGACALVFHRVNRSLFVDYVSMWASGVRQKCISPHPSIPGCLLCGLGLSRGLLVQQRG